MKIEFKNDPCLTCANCGDAIEPGDDYYEWDGEVYCSEECVKDALFEVHQDEVKDRHCYTADEQMAEYADMQYEAQRDAEFDGGNNE